MIIVYIKSELLVFPFDLQWFLVWEPINLDLSVGDYIILNYCRYQKVSLKCHVVWEFIFIMHYWMSTSTAEKINTVSDFISWIFITNTCK